MKTSPSSKVLAPYGAVQFLSLATKIGGIGGGKDVNQTPAKRVVVRLKASA